MYNPFKHSNTNKRYYSWNYYLRAKHGSKVGRASLNATFSCPNIDGTVGYGGCTFCLTGSAESFAPLEDQYIEQLEQMENKWNTKKHYTYFQAFTNTHASVDKLKETFEPFIGRENSLGLIVGTRADCLPDDVVEYLADINTRGELWVELGLQSSNDDTADRINRCHNYATFKEAVAKLRKHNINIAVHIINGLPGETEKEMIQTVKDINQLDIQAVKIHMLGVVKGTALAKSDMTMLTKEEYIDITIKQLELIDEDKIVQRLTGDPERSVLIKPEWIVHKSVILNDLENKMTKDNTWQGIKVNKQLSDTVHYVRSLMDRYSNKKNIVVDATIGNGHDALFLTPLNKEVIGFDIQDKAIKRSKERLADFDNVVIHQQSHEKITDKVSNFDLVVYNTGFLPGAEKNVTTSGETTLTSLLDAHQGLNKGGYILITIYKGHDNSAEYNAIKAGLEKNRIRFKETIIEDTEHAPSIITIKK